MPLFKMSKENILEKVRENSFALEKDIQRLTEHNIETIFKLNFVKSEFTIQSFRIDTLAYDTENCSFTIIEYKKGKNFSVIDQGYAYLSLMLNNKADFILEYNETQNDSLKRQAVDWSQSNVIFVAPSFTTYQKQAINFKDLPIELWEVKKYDNQTCSYIQIRSLGAQASVKTISRTDDAVKKVSKEIKVYTEDEHLINGSDSSKELYEKFKTEVINFENIEIRPKKHYIGFIGNTNVVDILVQKSQVKMWLNLKIGELDDPKGITRDVSTIGHWGNGDYEIKVTNDEEIEYIMSLVKQSYRKNGR